MLHREARTFRRHSAPRDGDASSRRCEHESDLGLHHRGTRGPAAALWRWFDSVLVSANPTSRGMDQRVPRLSVLVFRRMIHVLTSRAVILNAISSLLLFFANQLHNNDPDFGLCLTQAVFMYSTSFAYGVHLKSFYDG
jgi:hypothetical protein